MKKLASLTLLLLSALLLTAEEVKKETPKAEGPKKATINTYRVFPKDGHNEAVKAALAAHAKKYHTGNWKWRVSEVLSGPDSGAYMILEGPNSWTDIEGRGDMGAEHMKDYETAVLPHLEKSSPEIYATYDPECSTSGPSNFSPTKTLISYGYLKPGRGERAREDMKTWKKVYEKLGLNIGVWRTFFSGEDCLIVSGRLKAGFRDLDDDMNFRKTADELLGAGGFDKLMEQDTANYSRIVDEIIEFKPDLSSK